MPATELNGCLTELQAGSIVRLEFRSDPCGKRPSVTFAAMRSRRLRSQPLWSRDFMHDIPAAGRKEEWRGDYNEVRPGSSPAALTPKEFAEKFAFDSHSPLSAA